MLAVLKAVVAVCRAVARSLFDSADDDDLKNATRVEGTSMVDSGGKRSRTWKEWPALSTEITVAGPRRAGAVLNGRSSLPLTVLRVMKT